MPTKTNAKQARSLDTERRFLISLNELLADQSFTSTSIQQIADHAGLQKAAFTKRFGTKRDALFALFDVYCDAINLLIHELKDSHEKGETQIEEILFNLSIKFSETLNSHIASNRAMHELFLEDFETNERTKAIFKNATDLLSSIFQSTSKYNNDIYKYKVFNTTQLLVTLTYQYGIGAMPAFPDDPEERHRLIARLLITTMQ
jgi:AcrR family transcriptional regulator